MSQKGGTLCIRFHRFSPYRSLMTPIFYTSGMTVSTRRVEWWRSRSSPMLRWLSTRAKRAKFAKSAGSRHGKVASVRTTHFRQARDGNTKCLDCPHLLVPVRAKSVRYSRWAASAKQRTDIPIYISRGPVRVLSNMVGRACP